MSALSVNNVSQTNIKAGSTDFSSRPKGQDQIQTLFLDLQDPVNRKVFAFCAIFTCNFYAKKIRRYRSQGPMPKSQVRLIMLFAGSLSLTVLSKPDHWKHTRPTLVFTGVNCGTKPVYIHCPCNSFLWKRHLNRNPIHSFIQRVMWVSLGDKHYVGS